MPLSSDHRQLLIDHAPVLHYHGADPYRACSPATLTDAFAPDGASNALFAGDPPAIVALSTPTHRVAKLSLNFLAPEGERYLESSDAVASEVDYLSAGGRDLAGDWARAFVAGGSVDIAHARVQPGKDGRLWLQYWLFFYDNPFHVWFIGQHQGDWELIQIAYDGQRATRALYFQHNHAERRDWEDVQTVDETHPVVFIARDSHASYFEPGQHRRLGPASKIKPDTAAVSERPVRPTLHFLDEDTDRWLRWPGRWGATNGPIDKSPQGPMYQESRYADPERWWEDTAVVQFAQDLTLAGEAVPTMPSPPTLTIGVAPGGDAVSVTYAFPPRAPAGDVDPVWLRVAVHPADGGPPAVGTFEVPALSGTVAQPLPLGSGPYQVYVDVFDEHENERLIGPLAVPSAFAPQAAGAPEATGTPEVAGAPVAALSEDAGGEDASAALPARPLPLRPAMRRGSAQEPVRLVVQAPQGGPDAINELNAAIAGEGWQAEPLFGAHDPAAEPELSRFFTLTRPAQALPGVDAPGAAFQAARELDLGQGWTVEADVPSSVLVPDPDGPDHDAIATAGFGAAAASAFEDDWALTAIRAQAAWGLTPTPGGRAMGEGIAIGQPDTGYTDHYELQLAIDELRDRDVLDGDDDAHAVLGGIPPLRFPSHGTGTASVVASRTSHRVVGSAPLAQVVPIRTARSVILIRNAELAVAVDHARMVGCRVITISLGGVALPTALRVAIKRAVQDGVIVMAAAGQPLPAVIQPACFPECLAVAATTHAGTPWSLSARGSEVDWSAPGAKVLVAHTGNDGVQDVAFHSGTSFSVALSAGVAALWLAHHGPAIRATFAPHEVQGAFRSLVRATVTTPPPPGWDAQKFGPGVINAEQLLHADLGDADPIGSQGSADPVELIAAIAQEPAAELRPRLAALFSDGEAGLARHAEELAFRVAEHPAVRAELLGGDATGIETAALGQAALAPSLSPLTAVASPALRAALGPYSPRSTSQHPR